MSSGSGSNVERADTSGPTPVGRAPEFWLLRILHQIEDALLATLVAVMILVAGGQIVLRLGFESGLDWADALLRTLILWTALLGAMAAAREDKHLGLDAIPRLLKGVPLATVRFITQTFAAVICIMLAWYSVGLVQLERESQTIAFASVPTWITQLIMPAAFAVMGLRFGFRAFGIGVRHELPRP